LKKKSKIILVGSLALSLIISLFAFSATISYLADYERKDNIITIGDVKIEIDEGKYEDSSTVAAGSTLPKAPSIKNKGINDTYVFFKVAIPKKKVTLLYEQTTTDSNNVEHKEGTKYYDNPKEAELFKTIAEGENSASVSRAGYNNAGAALSAPDVIVGYNKGEYHSTTPENSKAGWVYLGSNPDQDIDSKKYDVYYFGYNKKLIPDPKTPVAQGEPAPVPPQDYWTTTLFDQIQLKSFIDEELGGKINTEVKVLVDAYGIQADDLGITLSEGILSDDQVKSVFEIVQRKRGVS
jgi:hypothetical protein